MTSFDGRLRLIGQPGMPLGVEVDLADGRMVITSGGKVVANWPIEEIEVIPRADGFHFIAEGEEVILNVSDKRRFANEIGLADL